MWKFAGLQFADPIMFKDLKLQKNRKYIIFLLTNKSLKSSHSNLRMNFASWDSFETELFLLRYVKICGFAICGRGPRKFVAFRFFKHYIFADLRFADWHTSKIYGFAISE